MEVIYIAVISVTAMGIVCAAVLSIASRLMYVKTDERIAELQECLPGANCGACGFPGCSGYAAALLSKKAKTNLCSPGGEEVLEKISAILGVRIGHIERRAAIVRCLGGSGVQNKKADYRGVQSCEASGRLFGGEGACAFGCLGYGDCLKVCPSNAIFIENSIARIDARACTGCGLCVKACPKNLITVEKADLPVSLLCRNTEKGAVVRKKCRAGCISCGKCVRECPAQAIVIDNNLAIIDNEKCGVWQKTSDGCTICSEVCMTGCIGRNVNIIKTGNHEHT
ncbi:MAG: RnfABCDGE type electron transport complex subunit B [Treponema sp.]|nr:RnfABCDGE type electron transport complex subunit B [Treponema sp.]